MNEPIKLDKHVRRDCAPEDIRRKAKTLFESGMGYRLVARELNLSVHTVRDWGRLFRRGKFREEISEKLLYYGPEAREAVWTLRRRGLSLRAIAARTGVSVSTCCVWIRRKEAELKAEAEATAEKIREKALMMDPVE